MMYASRVLTLRTVVKRQFDETTRSMLEQIGVHLVETLVRHVTSVFLNRTLDFAFLFVSVRERHMNNDHQTSIKFTRIVDPETDDCIC